jgi:phenylpyruvate tautomerase PptA (4-oxalocrotonate tautomerase family)
MPLVRISVDQATTPAERETIAQTVYEAMRASIGIPEGDKFILITPHGEAERFIDPGFMGMTRTSRHVLVQIVLRQGRSVEQKQALHAGIAQGLHKAVGVSTDDVMVVLNENTSADWSFGRGEAQFVLKEQAQSK